MANIHGLRIISVITGNVKYIGEVFFWHMEYLITCIYIKIILYLTSWGFTQLVASKDHSITLLMLGAVFSVATLIDGSKEFGEVAI